MGDVASEGRTVLFVSHNMAAVRSLCGRAIWLDRGQIIEAGETAQVVLSYLQRGAVATLEQVWEDPATAPGNEKVKIRSARLRSLPPNDGEEITVQSAIELEFEFWNYQADAVLSLTMHLFTIEGTYVFAVGSHGKPMPQGLARSSVRIPANLLNDGIYTVTIQVVQDTSSSVYLHPEILTFEVLDSVREINWFGKWPGVIRPKLEWI